jgi:RNA polymerase sigma-70 factor, ECF subfamily
MTRLSESKVIEHIPAMLRYARSLTRDESAAEDLVHDALVQAYTRAGQYRPDRPLRTWLFAILHNRFVSDVRHMEVQKKHRASLADAATMAQPPDQEARLRLSEVDRALQELSDDQRCALHLVGVEGLSYQEAASVLSIPIGTLISRISRARTRLREMEGDGTNEAADVRLRLVKD